MFICWMSQKLLSLSAPDSDLFIAYKVNNMFLHIK